MEVAHAICQNCRIELFEAKSNSFANLKAAVNTAAARGAEVISNSYGAYGFDCAPMAAYNKVHVAITVSAGDSGFAVACPANQSTVVAVGGTTLNLNGDGSYNSESVWSGTGIGLQLHELGAGVADRHRQLGRDRMQRSRYERRLGGRRPTWAPPSTTVRRGGWVQVGGTSLSAPLIGAVYALAGNAPSFAYPAQSVYASLGSLHDVTTGTNGSCGGHPLQCGAGAGYDLPTGIGTPNGLGGFEPPRAPPGRSFAWNASSTVPGVRSEPSCTTSRRKNRATVQSATIRAFRFIVGTRSTR